MILLALSVSWTVPPLDLLLYLQWNPNQHAPGNPNLINRKRNRKDSVDSYLRRPSLSMEEWFAREVVTVDGGEGDAGGGEEEWVEWIMERRSGSSGQEEWGKEWVHLSASSVLIY